jgi:aspartyl-tRNA(Asn)/glutamyl-tRNA(Gln) amidotransferase subunit A
VTGLKPTLYCVSLDGVVPLSPHLDHLGPIARSVADLRTVHSVLQRIPDPPSSKGTSLPRLSWLKGYFWERADDQVRRVVESAIRKLGDLVENHDWPDLPSSFSEVANWQKFIMSVDAAEYHRESYTEHQEMYGREIGALVASGFQVSAVDYARALRQQKQFATEFQNALGTTIVVTPATTTTAPPSLKSTGDPAFNAPWSFAGVPTVTIPCGLDKQGMPCGLQFIASKLDEPGLLAVAERCEERLNFSAKPGFGGG